MLKTTYLRVSDYNFLVFLIFKKTYNIGFALYRTLINQLIIHTGRIFIVQS